MSFVSTKFVSQTKERAANKGGNEVFFNPSSVPDGESRRFSPVGDKALDLWEIWGRDSEGKPKCLRFEEEPTAKELQDRANDEGVQLVDKQGKPTKLKPALAFWIWEYSTSSIKLFYASQASILETLASLLSDEDVAEDPGAWDCELSRHGTGLDTRYQLVLKPGRRKGTVKTEVEAAWAECLAEGYNLSSLITGGDPCKSPF